MVWMKSRAEREESPRERGRDTEGPRTRLRTIFIDHIKDSGFYPKTNDKLKILNEVVRGNLPEML